MFREKVNSVAIVEFLIWKLVVTLSLGAPSPCRRRQGPIVKLKLAVIRDANIQDNDKLSLGSRRERSLLSRWRRHAPGGPFLWIGRESQQQQPAWRPISADPGVVASPWPISGSGARSRAPFIFGSARGESLTAFGLVQCLLFSGPRACLFRPPNGLRSARSEPPFSWTRSLAAWTRCRRKVLGSWKRNPLYKTG